MPLSRVLARHVPPRSLLTQPFLTGALLTRALLIPGIVLAATVWNQSALAATPEAALTAWNRVLSRHVDDKGRVDFTAVAALPGDLDQYIASVAHRSPASHPGDFPSAGAILAHHLNAYNALSMKAVIAEGIPESLGGLTKYWFFGLRKHDIGKESLSLYAYENEVIRKLGDPRVHFALNCMSVGCPILPQKPFSATAIETELEKETRRFMAEERNVRVDHTDRVVWLSEIFDFFTEDFLAVAPDLITYVNRYRSEAVPQDYQVRFVDYDWTVNRQPAT
jgi:hypothetical protein